MATGHSTGSVPSFLPSIPIRPAIYRGQLYFEVGPVLFPSFVQAATAWSAAESHRLGIADEVEVLVVERTQALADLRAAAGRDIERFNAAAKREADLAVRIRRLRAEGVPRG